MQLTRRSTLDHYIVAGSTVENVGAGTTDQDIIAGTALERIISCATDEDVIVVETDISEVRAASLRFVYEVRRGDELLAEGYTRHAVIGADGRPRALPDFMRQLVSRTAD